MARRMACRVPAGARGDRAIRSKGLRAEVWSRLSYLPFQGVEVARQGNEPGVVGRYQAVQN
ncbi:MAG: hypothetical protein JWQ95_5588 [Sphaerisporangium sp.]|nr:hypothetical protein [Sphaerisporangium sp.]